MAAAPDNAPAPAPQQGGGLFARIQAHFEAHKNVYAIGIAAAGLLVTWLIYRQKQSGSGSTSTTPGGSTPTGTPTSDQYTQLEQQIANLQQQIAGLGSGTGTGSGGGGGGKGACPPGYHALAIASVFGGKGGIMCVPNAGGSPVPLGGSRTHPNSFATHIPAHRGTLN